MSARVHLSGLAIGAILGAGLVVLGSFTASAPLIAPPIVIVLKAPAEVAPKAEPVLPPAPLQASPQAALAPAPRSVPQKTSRAAKIRRTVAQLPDGLVAGLRRGAASASGVVARELAAGTRALERGAAYTAWAHFTRVLQLERDNHDALMGVALCHYELHQKRAAERALSKLLSLDATHPEASILRGFIAQLAGDTTSAIAWYERALPRLQDVGVAEELRLVVSGLKSPIATAGR